MNEPKDFSEQIEPYLEEQIEEADHKLVIVSLTVSAAIMVLLTVGIVAYLSW